MKETSAWLEEIFRKLNEIILVENRRRSNEAEKPVAKAEVILLGQISLLVHQEVAAILTLAQTADLDAKLHMDRFVKMKFKALVEKEGFLYDEDSHLIWIPKDAKFEEIYSFSTILVKAIDPESALLSKAIKARDKNKVLIREALASEHFPRLAERILEHGGRLEDFIE